MSIRSDLLRDAKNVTVQSKDYCLRPFSVRDLDGPYKRWIRDDELVKALDVAYVDRSDQALQSFAESVEADLNRLFYIIVERDTDRAIGTANVQVDPIHLYANFGYLIGEREFWGKGVAMQTQVSMFDFVFDHTCIERLYGRAVRDNVMSIFNFKRLGFTKEGIFRNHLRAGPDREGYQDAIYFGILKSEWLATRSKFDAFRLGGEA